MRVVFSPSYFSYGKTSCCSQKQWRASILRSKILHSSSSSRFSRSHKFSRWPSQRRPSKSSCLRSHSSKVGQHCPSSLALNKPHLITNSFLKVSFLCNSMFLSSPTASHCAGFEDSAAYECNGDGKSETSTGNILGFMFCS